MANATTPENSSLSTSESASASPPSPGAAGRDLETVEKERDKMLKGFKGSLPTEDQYPVWNALNAELAKLIAAAAAGK